MSIKCKIIRSRRRKTLALEVHRDGTVIVRAPVFTLNIAIRLYLKKMYNWVIKKQKMFAALPPLPPALTHRQHQKIDPKVLAATKKRARELFTSRLELYARAHNIGYRSLKLSSARTRWGSCSIKKNINLNWRLVNAPQEVLDYVIVHELSHTIYHNHSRYFWTHVASMMSDYAVHRKWLKDNGRTLYT